MRLRNILLTLAIVCPFADSTTLVLSYLPVDASNPVPVWLHLYSFASAAAMAVMVTVIYLLRSRRRTSNFPYSTTV